jgi:hypothetical protein
MPGSPPPSLLGGSLGSVRHLSSGATRLLRLPLLVTRLFVFLRGALTSLPPSHFARFGYSESLSRCAWALVGRFRPCSGSFAGEEVRRISQVPREPFRCLCPALRPRSDLHAKPVAAFQCCPRCSDYEGSNVDDCFEAQSHGFGIRSIRFVPTSLPTTQCSLLVGG